MSKPKFPVPIWQSFIGPPQPGSEARNYLWNWKLIKSICPQPRQRRCLDFCLHVRQLWTLHLKSNFVNISKQPKTPTLSCQSSSHGFVVEKMGGNAFLRKSIGCLTLGILRIAEDRIYIFYESWCIIGIIEHCDEIQTWGRYRIRIAIKTCFCGKRDKMEI